MDKSPVNKDSPIQVPGQLSLEGLAVPDRDYYEVRHRLRRATLTLAGLVGPGVDLDGAAILSWTDTISQLAYELESML